MWNYEQLYEQIAGRPKPSLVTLGDSNADIISHGRGFIGDFDLTLQLQVGCPGGCLYCYVPASFRLTPRDMQQNWGFEVRMKRNVVAKFRHHLLVGRLAGKSIFWSGVTDPYSSPPGLTRSIWETLNDAPVEIRPRRIAIQSRFRVDRDVDCIQEYSRNTFPRDNGPAVVVSMSIGTDRTEVIRKWERATPGFAQRMSAVERLCKCGVYVVVTLSPFGPWNDLLGTLERLKLWGVAYITVIFFKGSKSCAPTPMRFLEHLRDEWPFLLDLEWQQDRLCEIRSLFGRDRVLLDRDGFASLVEPQRILAKIASKQ